MIHRCHSWLGLLGVFLPWQLAQHLLEYIGGNIQELGCSQAEYLSFRTQVLSDNTLSPLVGGKLGFFMFIHSKKGFIL